MKIHIVGCGLSGITAAILLKEQGHQVEIFEARPHIGGNCYDKEQNGVMLHQYGAHIFHTPDKNVWNFLNRYTKFNQYTHRVRAHTKEGLLSIPFNKKTVTQLGRDLSPHEIQELIFKDYSERQWGIPWKELPKHIVSRLPVKRETEDDRYFTDCFQGIPVLGYTQMMQNMLEGIHVHTSSDQNAWRRHACDKLIYTGKPDEYFYLQYGKLPYRSLKFEHTLSKKTTLYSWKKGAVINECNTKPFNRTVDNSIFLNQTCSNTILTRDYPEDHHDGNEPIYPMNFGEGRKVFQQYKDLMKKEHHTIFTGRLATYKYLDMWMAIKQVMNKLAPHQSNF